MPLKSADTCRAKITDKGKQPRARSINFVDLPDVPNIPGLAPVSPDRYDKDTAIAGIKHRYARNVPVMDPKLNRRFKRFVARWVRSAYQPLSYIMSFDEWLASTSYNEHRKQQLREVYDRIVRGELHYPETRCERNLFRAVKAFIKLEAYPCYKNARHINARCDIAKVVFGPICKSMETVVYENPCFIKHVPLPLRPALLRSLKQTGCRYLESDHTAFEAHMSKDVMEVIEVTVIDHLLSKFPNLTELFAKVEMGENHISLDIGIKVVMQYCRCSGDMWTSLCNGLVNLLSFLFACDFIGSRFCGGYVEGDDGIFAVQGALPSSKLMERLGFEVKYVEHDDPATASFCGLILAGDDIIRDPVKFFQSFGWSDRFIGGNAATKRQLALAKALSALYETPNCPLVSAAARHVYNKTRGVTPRFDGTSYKQVPRDFNPPNTRISPQTRELFAVKFGVSPTTQVSWEAQIEKGDFSVLSDLPNVHPDVRDYATRYVERQ